MEVIVLWSLESERKKKTIHARATRTEIFSSVVFLMPY